MTNEDLQNLVIELEQWFDSKVEDLKSAADDIKGLEKLTVAINDDCEIKLDTREEVRAYRIGLLCAVGSIGEFPLEVVKKEQQS